MIKITLIDLPGDYRLTIGGDLALIRASLSKADIQFKYFNNLPVVSILYPTIETISHVVLIFSEMKPKVDNKIINMLQGEHFNKFQFPKGLPLSPYQQSLIRKIFRKNNLIINDDSGTGKTHTLIGLILGSKMTVTYIAPIDVLFQIKRIISRYYKNEVYELAMAKITFIPIAKKAIDIPSSDILIIDEVHRVFNKKDLIRAVYRNDYKIRILMTPKSKIYTQDKSILIKLLALKVNNDPSRLLEEYSHYGNQTIYPQTKPLIVQSRQTEFKDIIRRISKRPDKDGFSRLRASLSMERYVGVKAFIKKKLMEQSTIAIITSNPETKLAIMEDFPMFKEYRLGEDSPHTIFDPESSPDGIELDSQEVITLETYPMGSLAADFVYRFYRKALGEQKQSFYSVKTDHDIDKFFVESQSFSSIKNQLQYFIDKLSHIHN